MIVFKILFALIPERFKQLFGAYFVDGLLIFIGFLFTFWLFPLDFWAVPLGCVYLFYFTTTEGTRGTSFAKQSQGLQLKSKNLTWPQVLASYLIDGIVILEADCLVHVSLPLWGSGDAVVDSVKAGLAPFVFFFFYFTICEYLFGKTLGKKIMGITVVQKEISE